MLSSSLPRDLALAKSCLWGGSASRVQAAEPPKARVMAGAMARGNEEEERVGTRKVRKAITRREQGLGVRLMFKDHHTQGRQT